MKKIDLKCNGCGAPMQLSEDNSYAECPYCKNKVLLKTELSLEEQSKRAEELSYAKEKGCFLTGTEDSKIENINVVEG